MSALTLLGPLATERELERRIEQHRLWMAAAKSDHIKRFHLNAMSALIAKRSPTQVARMDCAKGLR